MTAEPPRAPQATSQPPAVAPSPPIGLRDLAVATMAAVFLLPLVRVLGRNGDEGTLVYGAVRVLEGDLPYRDFFECMTPGSFYWLAAFFRLFGTTFAVSRGVLLATGVGLTLLVDRLARRLAPGPYDVLPSVFALVLGIPFWTATSHHWDSTLFAVASCLALVRWVERPTHLRLFLAGLLTAVTAEFVQQKGVMMFAGCLAAILVASWQARTPWRETLARCVVLAAGPFLLGAATLLFFHRHSGLSDLLEAVVVMPLTRYGLVNKVPYGFYFWESYVPAWLQATETLFPGPFGQAMLTALLVPLVVVLVAPFLILAACARRLWHYVRTPADPRKFDPRLPAVALAAFALWASESHRPDLPHLLYGSPLLFVTGFRLLRDALAPHPRMFRTTAMGLLFCIGLTGLSILLPGLRPGQWQETRRGPVWTTTRDACLDFLMRETRPGEEVFVYPYYPMYYFLAALKNPVRFSILTYGGYNTPAEFAQVVETLEARRVRLVLWDTLVDHATMRSWFPNYRTPPPEEQVVEKLLKEEFEELGREGDFRVMRRRAP
ncbi:MAG: hypothetical protein GX442_07640 [Candidatus Riflebacteria bacterium]|nr:hypothetical protein [Candidatus Riflebacteria bacterium]